MNRAADGWGMYMRRRGLLLGLWILAISLLAGCASGTAHITVRKNGSADLDMRVTLKESVQKLTGDKLREQLQAKAEQLGFDFESKAKDQETDYMLHKRFDSLQENMKEWDFAGGNMVTVTKHYFYTKMDVRLSIDLGKYVNPLIQNQEWVKVPEYLLKLTLQRLHLDFMLTLPISTFGNNNADEVKGNTMKWILSLTKPTEIHFAFLIPRIKHILIGAGVLLAVLVLLIILFIRWIRIRKRRRNAAVDPGATPEDKQGGNGDE
ncbi:hypothetical protein [Paenibacillus nasutitermitis]|uniref:DUF3153 domain-containing protein n=1 Tax=Paenibacillus nasutitermitis TaxID=1652958 RepID=A0A916ZE38_9BACL|nr:hypothetical protein [Paenibacillus nasutitermitis]GGD90324.1 hypothetical protein GCM10010911_56240 [Paenibacillus nasutitermitis]